MKRAAIIGFGIGTAWVLIALLWRLREYERGKYQHQGIGPGGIGVLIAAGAWLLWAVGLWGEVEVQKWIQRRNRRWRP